MTPDVIVKNGIFLCMEGRHVFRDLTVEENLMAGAYSRKDRANIKADIEKIYRLFSKTKSFTVKKSGLFVWRRATNACNW